MRENIAVVAVGASVTPMLNTSKRTLRLAISAPVLSLSVTEAVPLSPSQSVAAVVAALLTGAQMDPAAGVMVIKAEAMVAGVTVTVTIEVAAALSVTVNVTGVATATFVGVKVNDAPLTWAVTGNTAALLDTTVNGPLPPVMPTVLGVLPNATKVAGPASRVLLVTGVLDELPPQPERPRTSVDASAHSASLPKRV